MICGKAVTSLVRSASFRTEPKPHRDVYTVINASSADQKGRWVRIGATFLNKDGSESVLLDALPVNGKLQLPPRPSSAY
jgi:hypothetical protein